MPMDEHTRWELFFGFAARFVSFSPTEKEVLASALTFRRAETKTELVSFDKRTDELFFILKGCVRKYFVKDGEQITLHITVENSFIGAFDSFLTGSRSNQTIECLEPCDLLVLKKRDLDRLYQEIPPMNEFLRKLLEQALLQFQNALVSFILLNPEERYEAFVSEHPEILQRVPQHMLATYLGVTATSLSRIRKRIAGKP